MARPGVVVVLDMDVSWTPFRLERVVLFSVQSCILQQLGTIARHLQRSTRFRLALQPVQRLGPNRAVGVRTNCPEESPVYRFGKNSPFFYQNKAPSTQKNAITGTFVGFQRLAQLHSIRLVQPLLIRSRLGAVRQREVVDGRALLTWPAQYQPSDSFRGHFEFGLKYERLHFEFFSRLFAALDPEDMAAWVRDEPTGRYARRTPRCPRWCIWGRQPSGAGCTTWPQTCKGWTMPLARSCCCAARPG